MKLNKDKKYLYKISSFIIFILLAIIFSSIIPSNPVIIGVAVCYGLLSDAIINKILFFFWHSS